MKNSKKTFKRVIASLLVVLMLVSIAPMESLTGIGFGDFFGIKAEALSISGDGRTATGISGGQYIRIKTEKKSFLQRLFNFGKKADTKVEITFPREYCLPYVTAGMDLHVHLGKSEPKVYEGAINASGAFVTASAKAFDKVYKLTGEADAAHAHVTGSRFTNMEIPLEKFNTEYIIEIVPTVREEYSIYQPSDVNNVKIKVKSGKILGEADGSVVTEAKVYSSANKVVRPIQTSQLYFSNQSSSNIAGKSATISGSIKNAQNQKISSYGIFVKADSSKFSNSDIKWQNNNATTKNSISVSKTIGNLEPNTKYYYAIFAKTAGGTYCSSVMSFKTPKVNPEKTSISALNVINYRNNQKINSKDLGVGENVYIKWNTAKYAEWYTVSVNGVENSKKIYGTDQTLTLDNTGENQIRVRAHNSAGSSDWTAPIIANVHSDIRVNFYVGDSLYQSQKLTWGHDLTKLPNTPSQLGKAFAGWYLSDGMSIASFDGIKNDLNVFAKYAESKYTVKFCDQKGNIIKGSQQVVEYGNSAVAPSDMSFVPAGYQFVGWNKAFDCVKENLTVTAVVDLENQNLPTEVTNVSAIRNAYGYVIECDVTNLALKNASGRIVVALKTDTGKLVTTTESAAYYINAKEVDSDTGEYTYSTEHIKTVVPNLYDDETQNVTALTAEVYSVERFQTVVPVSSKVSVAIVDADPWTDWKSTQKSGYSEANTQTMTQYRSRKYLTTTTTSAAERDRLVGEGWTYNASATTQVKDKNSGTWSKTKPAGVLNTDYAQKTVTDKAASTVYKYKRYKYNNAGTTYYSYGSGWATSHGLKGAWEYKETKEPLAYKKTYDGWYAYVGMWFSNSGNKTNPKVTIPAVTHQEYRAFNTIYTYHLNKWQENFSEWSTTPINNLGNPVSEVNGITTYQQATTVNGVQVPTLEIQTRNLYRYYDELPRVCDNNGVVRSEFTSGTVDASLAGKQATLVIYKINEAADWTIEHIDQTVIDGDGSYTFEEYKLREEPSAITGDMTAVLGIEGSTGAFYLGKIEAPKTKYTIQYVDSETASIIDTFELVDEGSNLIPPTPPEHEGKTFSHWDMRSTNISPYMVDEGSENTITINAIYKKNTYTVVFIDWTHNLYDIQTYEHGASLEPPVLEGSNIFNIDWDIEWDQNLDNYPPVTSNMVITAKYITKTFTVSFYDYDMNLIDQQQVEYGKSPTLPELSDDDNHFFFGWSTNHDLLLENNEEPQIMMMSMNDENIEDTVLEDEYIDVEDFEVKTDCAMYPQFIFSETTATPIADITTGTYGEAQTVTLSCDTEGAVIYYTLDGSDPKDMDGVSPEEHSVFEYESPITVSTSSQLRFFAQRIGMDASETVVENYAINDGNGNNNYIVNLFIDDPEAPEITTLVEEGSQFDMGLLPVIEGYTFDGVYRDVTFVPGEVEDDGSYIFSNPWNVDNDTIISDINLYVKYNINSYTVRFIDYDGQIISEQEVEYLSSAQVPEDPIREGYVFVGWDNEDCFGVTDDIEINAQYIPENDYVRIELNHTRFSTMNGSNFKLNAMLTPNEGEQTILWYSDNENVAMVDDEGNVTATGIGTTVITAEVESTGEESKCIVVVSGDPTTDISLIVGSNYSFDANGYLRNITLIKDEITNTRHAQTVEQVKSQLANDGLTVVSANGIVLAENDYIGTGSTIQIKDGSTVLDERTVIVTGDVDGNGLINNRDASRISRFLVDKEEFDIAQLGATDVNGDGYVNNRDASMLARYLVDKETI